MSRDTFPELSELRQLFPVTERCAYLDHAAVSTLSQPVREAMAEYLDERSLWGENAPYEDVSDSLREELGKLINAEAEEIAFVQNTSEGLNVIANALPLKSGDNVLFCDMEFPSNVYPWMNLQRRGIEARCVSHHGGGLTVDLVAANADDLTRVVAVSSVQFLTGFRSDLGALGAWCRAHDAYLVVDGIQSVGVLPLDVRACQIDFLACGGPKWLMGPAGQGFMYVRSELLDDLKPPFAGCVSVAGWQAWRRYDLSFLPNARRFELGCANLVGQVGLLAAVRLLLSLGIETIEARTLRLTDVLIEDLQQRGYQIASNSSPGRRSSIVSFRVPGDVGRAHANLLEADVVVSRREELIRVSPHCYNTEDEVLRVGEALDDVD
jgi:selenocysteine lyase/cysteine desulfurase